METEPERCGEMWLLHCLGSGILEQNLDLDQSKEDFKIDKVSRPQKQSITICIACLRPPESTSDILAVWHRLSYCFAPYDVSLTSRLPEYLQSGCRLWCGRIHVACSMPYRAGGLHPRLSIDLHWERLCGPVDYKQDTNEGYEVDL